MPGWNPFRRRQVNARVPLLLNTNRGQIHAETVNGAKVYRNRAGGIKLTTNAGTPVYRYGNGYSTNSSLSSNQKQVINFVGKIKRGEKKMQAATLNPRLLSLIANSKNIPSNLSKQAINLRNTMKRGIAANNARQAYLRAAQHT